MQSSGFEALDSPAPNLTNPGRTTATKQKIHRIIKTKFKVGARIKRHKKRVISKKSSMKAGNGFQEKRSTTEINPNQILKQQHRTNTKLQPYPKPQYSVSRNLERTTPKPPPQKNTEDKVLTLFTAYTLNPDP